ncbi:MAG TPA: dTDP-glucose 4,6-dehydratase [Synergistales bacterium]|nr:dTDP-glucose 4,6-dehydratase [Synergistales bacterium]
MRILLTGGAGFIGSNLVRYLLSREKCSLINLDNLTYAGNLESISDLMGNDRHLFVHGDVTDKTLLSSLFRKHNPSAVINLAAETHVDRSIDHPGDFVRTNIHGAFTILEAAREYWDSLCDHEKQAFRFIHVSTDEVYGPHEKGRPLLEGSPYAPRSPYSASKASSDHLARAYHATYGFPAIITISSNNYGPYQFPEKLIPLMIQKALHSEKLPVYGDGSQIRDWLYVEDNCRALISVLFRGRPGETYNIGGSCEKTNLQVVRKICRILDNLKPRTGDSSYLDLISFVSDRPGHDKRYAIDSTKILKETGWTPLETFQEGLTKTVNWYLKHQTWIDNVTSGKYRMERLGLGYHVKEED